MNWRKWNQRKRERSERARRAAEARWTAYHAALADAPPRETRVQEITIRDSHRSRTVIRLEAELTRDDRAWGRRRMWLNGEPFGRRPIGRTSAADTIAEALR